ncbi:cell division protein SepF [Candidatus Bathyarchaeota archaeon]|nr:cell division protein SepF [Candidatus Bathyarchaeota archaeon]
MPLRSLVDIEVIKHEISLGNIIILKITPLARKNVEEVKNAVNELYSFTQSIGGDIASLGQERVVIVPNSIRIWRPETGVSKEAPNAA